MRRKNSQKGDKSYTGYKVLQKYRGGRNHFMRDKKGFLAKTAFELPSGWRFHIGIRERGLSLQMAK